ncbi:MAG TPA: glycosyltransferase [Verrucomicrobia bacterium]|nr:glycosyltransferase [Verrucomicrobiota bacterium]
MSILRPEGSVGRDPNLPSTRTIPEEFYLSVIVPACNEADCLPALVEALLRTLHPLHRQFEIILVDDASTDSTAAVIHQLHSQYPEVVGLFHKANHGQSAAIVSALHIAQGHIVVTMDADMQNPPEEIPRLLAHLTPGTDAVCGVRLHRNDPAIRRFASVVANRFRNLVTGVPVEDAGCGLRVILRSATTELPVFNGLHRFMTTILKLQGFRVKEVPIAHQPRLAGASKYGINDRLWRGIADCIAMRWYARRVIPVRRGDDQA